MKGKRELPASEAAPLPRRRRQRTPKRARVAIGLLSGALALCIGLIGALGSLYLTQLRQNQFSKNVVFSQNYSLRSALLDGGVEESPYEAPADFSLLEADPYVVLDTFRFHLVQLTVLRLQQDGEAFSGEAFPYLYDDLWNLSSDGGMLIYELLFSLAYAPGSTENLLSTLDAPDAPPAFEEMETEVYPTPSSPETEVNLASALERCAQYLCQYFALPLELSDTLAAALSLTAHVAQVEVEPVYQLPDYPNGCESAAAVSLLRSIGVDVTLKEFVDEYLPKQDVRISFGCCYGPDPQQYYAGNPDAGQGGWGCFAPVIAAALESALPQGSAYTVCNLSGAALDELSLYLSFGVPVALWTTTDGKPANEFYQWQSYDQTQTYLYPKNQHCVVLCGVRPDPDNGGMVYQYMDPLTGQVEEMGSQQLNTCYTSMGYQAVALLPDALADCIRCG